LVDVNRVANRLFLAFKIEVQVTGDLLRHFLNKPFGHIASACQLFGIRLHHQIENRPTQDIFGEVVGAGEGTAGIALYRSKARQMSILRGARALRRRVFGPTLRRLRSSRDEQKLAVIEGKPCLPLSVRNLDAIF
jgi:hypothetical protein